MGRGNFVQAGVMESFALSALAAFAGGALSFLSPCVLPLVPGYLCFAAGLQFNELTDIDTRAAARRVLPGASAFVGGFSAVFIALGAGAAAVNPVLLMHQDILAQVAGGFIIILGLHVGGLVTLPLLGREARLLGRSTSGASGAPTASLFAAFFMGAAFAFGWTPCIGPILATILALAAARDSLGEGVGLLTFYAAGLGLPFLLAALGVSRFLLVSAAVKKHMKWVERSAGVLLVGTGLLIMLGTLQALPPICSTGFRHWVNWVKFVLVMMRHFQNIPAGALFLGVSGLIPFVAGGFGLAAAFAKHRTHHSAAGVFLRRANRFFSGRGALGAAMQRPAGAALTRELCASVYPRSSRWSVIFFRCRRRWQCS